MDIFLYLFAPYTVCMSRYIKANHRVLMIEFVRRDVWRVSRSWNRDCVKPGDRTGRYPMNLS